MRPLQEIGKLVRAWWRIDRIRIPPTAGRILQLCPGQIVLIRGQLFRITDRRIQPTRDGVHVQLILQDDHSSGVLLTRIAASDVSSSSVSSVAATGYSVLRTGHLESVIYDQDVVVVDAAEPAGVPFCDRKQ